MHEHSATTDGDGPASGDAPPPPTVTTAVAGGESPAELEARILTAGRRLHRARVRLLTALAAYDTSGQWALAGARTCAHWAADRLEITVSTAREWLRIAHALAALPDVADAFARGALSYAKVRTLTRIAIDHPDHQQELVELCAPVPAGDVAHRLAGWCHRNEDPDTRDRRQRRRTGLWARAEPDGMRTLIIRGPATLIAGLERAVDARVMQGVSHPDEEGLSLAHQRVLAVSALCTSDTAASINTELLIHVRGDGCSLTDGTPIDDNTVTALLGEAFIRALIHDADNHPIDASNRRRAPTTRQRRVVDARHPTCVDCGSTELLEYDHEPPYNLTRHTHTDELLRRCAPCHRRRHETG